MNPIAGRVLITLAWALACGCGPPSPDADDGEAARAGAARAFWKAHDEAKARYVAGDLIEAADAYQRALAQNPRHAGSLYAAAHVAFLLNRHAEARALLGRLQSADPLATKAWLLEASVLSDPFPGAPFDLDEAARAVSRARSMNAEDSEVAVVEGRIAWLQGDRPRADERLATASRTNPKNAPALLLLGWASLQADDRAAASAWFEKAEAAAKGTPPPAQVKGEGDTQQGGAGEAGHRAIEARFGAWIAANAEPAAGGMRIDVLDTALRAGGAVACTDLDGDGDLDLVAGSATAAIRIYENDRGRLTLSRETGPSGVCAIACGDFDGDGAQDLFVALGGRSPSAPAILLNAGALRFRDVAGPGITRRADVVLAADLDGDGSCDLADAGPSDRGATVRLWRNAGRGVFAPLEMKGLPGTGVPTALASVRLSEGRRDLVVTYANRPPWTTHDGSTGLERAGPARAAAVLDLDRDGYDDLVFADRCETPAAATWAIERRAGPRALRAFRGRGDGTFAESEGSVPALAAGLTWIAAGDVDGDGWTDLATGCGGPEPWRVEPWYVLLNRGGTCAAVRAPRVAPLQAAAACVADLDGDGRSEIVLAGGGSVAEPGRLAVARGIP